MLRWKTASFFIVTTLLFFLLTGCGTATRYLGYRISPDRVDTTGDIQVPVEGLTNPVTIYLDEYAIPHIEAADESSLYFAIGYMQGRDRRFEMEMFKMVAAGRLRELIGDNDRTGVMTRLEVFSRMIGLYQEANNFIETMSPEDLTVLQAFADGVNAATANEPRAMEFRLLDYEPEPWKVEDCGLIIALLRFGLCKNWELELGRFETMLYQIQTGGSIERTLEMWPNRYRMGPFLVGQPLETDPFADYAPVAPELVEYLTEFAKEHPRAIEEPRIEPPATETSFWQPFLQGRSCSNNWAVDGQWTGTGKSALAGDPQMPHFLPSMGYLYHAKCTGCETGSYEVIGGSFVGLPAIAFGSNGNVAWGSTSNWADVSDLYVEKVAPGKPDHYLHNGRAIPFGVREEIFKIRRKDGTFLEEKLSIRTTRHGVIVNDFIDRLPPGFPLMALQRDMEWGKPLTALRKLYQAKNVDEGRLAMYDFSTLIGHWGLADDSGDIAYVGSVRMPLRTKHLGTVPVPGWIDTYDWGKILLPQELPFIKNPPAHWLGTANNQVLDPESTTFPIAVEGDVPHRSGRIGQVLGQGNDGRSVVEQLGRLHLDNIDLGWPEVRQLYTRALANLRTDDDAVVAEAARTLLIWDGTTGPDDVAPSIFQSLNAFVIERVLNDEMSRASLDYQLHFFNAEPFVYSILRNPKNPAWDNRRTEQVETAETEIAAAFRDVVQAMRTRHDDRVEAWTWSKVAPFVLEHPFGSEKALAGHVNRGPLGTRGSGNTVFKHQFMRAEMTDFPIKYGPVLRVNIDLSDMSKSIMSLPGGQSGRPTSPHYDDLLPFFLDGTGVPMTMGFEQWPKKAAGRIVLQPK